MTEQLGKAERALAVGHGVYYVATGLWPIVHLRSFEKITGPKPEGWLVKTVGALITVVGGVVLWSGLKSRKTPEVRMLAVGAAAALGAVDVIYPLKGRISKVYLADALPELFLTLAWSSMRKRQPDATGRRLAGRALEPATAPANPASTLIPVGPRTM